MSKWTEGEPSNTGESVYGAPKICDQPGGLWAVWNGSVGRRGQGQRVEMQFYDVAQESVVWVALDQERFKRFTDRTHRMIASRSAAAPKVMHRHVERLPACALGRFHEQRICKALDRRKFRAKKVEVSRTRLPRGCVAVLDQGFDGDRPRSLGLFVERCALRGPRNPSQDSAPVYRRR
jgi:hypothetical protein